MVKRNFPQRLPRSKENEKRTERGGGVAQGAKEGALPLLEQMFPWKSR